MIRHADMNNHYFQGQCVKRGTERQCSFVWVYESCKGCEEYATPVSTNVSMANDMTQYAVLVHNFTVSV